MSLKLHFQRKLLVHKLFQQNSADDSKENRRQFSSIGIGISIRHRILAILSIDHFPFNKHKENAMFITVQSTN